MTRAAKKRDDLLEFLLQVEKLRAEQRCSAGVKQKGRIEYLSEGLNICVNWVWRLMGIRADRCG